MKRSAVVIIIMLTLIPVTSYAQSGIKDALLNNLNIENIEQLELTENNNILSTTAHITTLEGKEFLIPVTVDKKNVTATFEFASGKTVIVTPSGTEVIQGSGYQKYDDIDNSTH